MRIALLLAASVAYAAAPVEVWSTAQLKSEAAKFPPSERVSVHTLGSWGSHSASLVKRTSSGEAELHKTKADLMMIQEGAATLVYGGSIAGAHPTTAGEIRGSSIRDGQSRRLAPGDVVHIAPNTPHQFLLDKGQSISYVALKVTR